MLLTAEDVEKVMVDSLLSLVANRGLSLVPSPDKTSEAIQWNSCVVSLGSVSEPLTCSYSCCCDTTTSTTTTETKVISCKHFVMRQIVLCLDCYVPPETWPCVLWPVVGKGNVRCYVTSTTPSQTEICFYTMNWKKLWTFVASGQFVLNWESNKVTSSHTSVGWSPFVFVWQIQTSWFVGQVARFNLL